MGTQSRPRMCVCVTDKHMYVQFIDDGPGVTLGEVSTLKNNPSGKNNIAAAQDLGKRAAKMALDKGIANVVFDRGGNMYKGRVKAIAEVAREAGLKL